jgi:hypothetical protein
MIDSPPAVCDGIVSQGGVVVRSSVLLSEVDRRSRDENVDLVVRIDLVLEEELVRSVTESACLCKFALEVRPD